MIEELLAVSFFLVLSALVMQHMHASRNAGIWWGLIGSMIFFGMIHFVAYDWHILQMLLVIGVGRILILGCTFGPRIFGSRTFSTSYGIRFCSSPLYSRSKTKQELVTTQTGDVTGSCFCLSLILVFEFAISHDTSSGLFANGIIDGIDLAISGEQVDHVPDPHNCEKNKTDQNP